MAGERRQVCTSGDGMGKLIIIRGNSGSGKTSLAKLLQKKLGPNTLRVSHDMIRMDLLNVRGREGVERSEPLMTTLLRYGRANSEVTILEGILPARDYSRLFEAALAIFGADIYAYYYDLPFDETLRRHMTKPNRDDFGEADMRRWWVERDYLKTIPVGGVVNERILGAELSLDDAVELIMADVAGIM